MRKHLPFLGKKKIYIGRKHCKMKVFNRKLNPKIKEIVWPKYN